ncbi:hypothetical protein SLEP1_g52240 [Rubroshorea leprosula]|uniref:Uncharacterized protein n=1 Tax=Rubroshorea leprosula TaxID=152421 RepID=A0AAV5M5N2_9ROSI|nr:hypothetical protein SLEP1_g52240 [Rubroshorea leprosula]
MAGVTVVGTVEVVVMIMAIVGLQGTHPIEGMIILQDTLPMLEDQGGSAHILLIPVALGDDAVVSLFMVSL